MNLHSSSQIESTHPSSPSDAGRACPVGEVTSGLLHLSGGASDLRLGSDRNMGQLFRARFDDLSPRIDVVGGHVHVRQRLSVLQWLESMLSGRSSDGLITLNGLIPWEVSLHGGASEVVADLSGLTLLGFSLRGGVSHATVTLPNPKGLVPVRITGGVSHLTLRRPEGVPVSVSVRGGISSLQLDGNYYGAIGGPLQLEAPGGTGGADRYVVEVSGGASHLTVCSVAHAEAKT